MYFFRLWAYSISTYDAGPAWERFQIPELICLVLSFMALDERNRRATALVNKAWSEVVLDEHWRAIRYQGIVRLFEILQPMIPTVTKDDWYELVWVLLSSLRGDSNLLVILVFSCWAHKTELGSLRLLCTSRPPHLLSG